MAVAALAVAVGLSVCGCSAGTPEEDASESPREAQTQNEKLESRLPNFAEAQSVPVGDVTTRSLEVRNDSSSEVIIGSIGILSADAENPYTIVDDSCEGRIAPQATCTITVAFAPTEVGPIDAVVRVRVPADNSVLDIPLRLTGMSATAGPATPDPTKSANTPSQDPAG